MADPIVGFSEPDDWIPHYDQYGTMKLVTKNLAVFTTKSGSDYEFIPWPSDIERWICY